MSIYLFLNFLLHNSYFYVDSLHFAPVLASPPYLYNMIVTCISFAAPYYSFVKEATSAQEVSYYDYIIVGGGTAGCPLAATLSASANVLVLERGGSPYINPGKSDKGNFFPNVLDRSPGSYSQPFTSEDGVYNARARVLGGGSVINAGFYSHAEPGFLKQAGLNEALV